MIFIFGFSFIGYSVYPSGYGPGRQRAADHHAILQQDQSLGRPAKRQVEMQLVFLSVLQLSLCTGRAGREDHLDTVCAKHVAEPHMDKALLIGRHIFPPTVYFP